MDIPLKKWVVALETPIGFAELIVPTFLGAEAAGRRAVVVAAQMRWGDLDEVDVLAVREATESDLREEL